MKFHLILIISIFFYQKGTLRYFHLNKTIVNLVSTFVISFDIEKNIKILAARLFTKINSDYPQ